MNTIALLSVLVLAAPPDSSGLVRNPNGFFGFKWGISMSKAKKTAPVELSCPSGRSPSKECTATLPNPTGRVLKKENVPSKLSLLFYHNRLVKVWLFRGDAAPGGTILQLHNLFGEPSHKITLPSAIDRVMLFSWVKDKTVVNLEIGPMVEGVATVSVSAYSTSYYRTLKSLQ
jgi:hypothetical protein